MDLADVEGIVGGADEFLVLLHGVIVAHVVHAVVMVANGVVQHHALDAGGIGQVFLEGVVVRDPVEIPGHVAEGEGIDLPGRRGNGGVDVLHETGELLLVVGPAGEVDVTQHEHPVVILSVGLFQLEINPFRHIGRRLERRVELGQDAAHERLVAGRGGHEDVAVVLLGLHLVHALGIRLHDFDAVGDDNPGETRPLAGDLPIDRAAVGRLHFFVAGILDRDVRLAFQRPVRSAHMIHIIGTGAESAGPGRCDGHAEPSFRHGGDGTGVFRRTGPQDDLVRGQGGLGELDAERNLGGALFHRHRGGHFELDIHLFGRRLVLVAGCRETEEGKNQ